MNDYRASTYSLYSKRDLNPHNHYWSRDFKSLVSTDSTIRAAFFTLAVANIIKSFVLAMQFAQKD